MAKAERKLAATAVTATTPPPFPAEAFTTRITYFDHVQVRVPQEPSRDVKARLERSCGDFDDDRSKDFKGWTLFLYQPTQKTWHILRQFLPDHVVSFVEIALDYTTTDRTAITAIREYLDPRITLLQPPGSITPPNYVWRNPKVAQPQDAEKEGWDGTLYLARKHHPENIAVYSNRVSKMKDQPCCHVEYRMRGAPELARIGVRKASDLLSFDHRRFWKKHLRLFELPDPATLARWWRGGKRVPGPSPTRVGRMLERASARGWHGTTAQAMQAFLQIPISEFGVPVDNRMFLPPRVARRRPQTKTARLRASRRQQREPRKSIPLECRPGLEQDPDLSASPRKPPSIWRRKASAIG